MAWHEEYPDTFGAIREADIDLLLHEELRCDPAFRRKFLGDAIAALGLVEFPASGRVYINVHRTGESSGQSDLLIEFNAKGPKGNGTYAILIEDKIDAAFSDRVLSGVSQLQRYRREIEVNVESGRWKAGVVVLAAPEVYLSYSSAGFDATINLNQIADWFQKRAIEESPEWAARFEHRRQVFQHAITRATRGWQRSPHPKVTELWTHYASIASGEFPELMMIYRGDAPPDSYTVSFCCLPRVEGLPACRIEHVMERGRIHILAPGFAGHLEVLTNNLVEPGISVRKAGKALAITISIEPIDRFLPAEASTETIRTALRMAQRLKDRFPVYARILQDAKKAVV